MPDNDQERAPVEPATLREFLAQQPSANPADAIQRFLEYLAGRGGHAFAAEAYRAGHADAAVLAALRDDPDDKRRKARARAAELGGEPVVWLTTPGWRAVGNTSRREVRPSTQSLAHADAPRLLAKALTRQLAAWTPVVTVSVVTDPGEITTLSETAKARAWARLRNAADADGGIGALTGGFRPDALVVERWWSPEAYAAAHAVTVAPEPDDYAEVVWAVEVEHSAKSEALLADKVRRLDTARDLGLIRGTVWVTRSRDVGRALHSFGIGADHRPRPGHFVLRSHQVGADGDAIRPALHQWWPFAQPSE